MIEIVLPRLVGSRIAAQKMVANLPAFDGARVVVNCRDLRSASSSFADELVRLLLDQDPCASELVLLGVSDEFERYVKQAASARGVAEHVVTRPAGSEVGA